MSEHGFIRCNQRLLPEIVLRTRVDEGSQVQFQVEQVAVPAPTEDDRTVYATLAQGLRYAGFYVNIKDYATEETSRVYVGVRTFLLMAGISRSYVTIIGELVPFRIGRTREAAQREVQLIAREAANHLAHDQGNRGHRVYLNCRAFRTERREPPVSVPQYSPLVPEGPAFI